MGAENRITRTKYQTIKAELHSPQDDKRAMEKYHIGQTTARNIRNSPNYDFYRQWVAKKIHKTRIDVTPPQVVIAKEPLDELAPEKTRGAEIAAAVFLVLFLIMTGITIILLLDKLSTL